MSKHKPNNPVEKFLNYLDERFGIKKENFFDYDFDTDGERLNIFSAGINNKNLEGLIIKSTGLRAGKYFKNIRNGRVKLKISTNFAQIFGRYATKNVLQIHDAQVKEYIRGSDLENIRPLKVEEGEVIIKWNENVIGVGNY
ncbi:MAG: hypothetical protein QMD06_01290, partial [Candidatus Altarchaeum sp.]|nr:hypothetical protein [Candidatus Altarchaeum sp.]